MSFHHDDDDDDDDDGDGGDGGDGGDDGITVVVGCGEVSMDELPAAMGPEFDTGSSK